MSALGKLTGERCGKSYTSLAWVHLSSGNNVIVFMCREFGKKLFMDPDRLSVRTAWGSFTDSQYIHSGPLSPMKGRFAYVWAGAVLHVLTAADVKAFITNVHTVLAPGGTFLGVRLEHHKERHLADLNDLLLAALLRHDLL